MITRGIFQLDYVVTYQAGMLLSPTHRRIVRKPRQLASTDFVDVEIAIVCQRFGRAFTHRARRAQGLNYNNSSKKLILLPSRLDTVEYVVTGVDCDVAVSQYYKCSEKQCARVQMLPLQLASRRGQC